MISKRALYALSRGVVACKITSRAKRALGGGISRRVFAAWAFDAEVGLRVQALAFRALRSEKGECVLLLITRLVAQVPSAYLERQLSARLLLERAVDVLIGPLCHATALAVDDDSEVNVARWKRLVGHARRLRKFQRYSWRTRDALGRFWR